MTKRQRTAQMIDAVASKDANSADFRDLTAYERACHFAEKGRRSAVWEEKRALLQMARTEAMIGICELLTELVEQKK